MQINLKKILWRTRGRDWDYRFVLRPAPPFSEDWYEFHSDVFQGVSPENTPVHIGGIFYTANEEGVAFVATAFLDDSKNDNAGRPIAHYMVLFPDVSGRPASYDVASNWGPQLVAKASEGRSDLSSDDGDFEDLLGRDRDHLKVSLEAGQASVRLDRSVYQKKKTLPQPITNRTKLLVLAVGAVVFAMVILAIYRNRPPSLPHPAP